MREGSKLPSYLWPIITSAAVYLYNRTPKRMQQWKSPYERFYTHIAQQEGAVAEPRKPDQTHLRAYGCKAFAMTPTAQKREQRLQRFNPKAWIGYLVRYKSSNIFRVWVPATNKVISTRDVIFNEEEFFNGDLESLKDDLKDIQEGELVALLKKVTLSEAEPGDADDLEEADFAIPDQGDEPPGPQDTEDLGDEVVLDEIVVHGDIVDSEYIEDPMDRHEYTDEQMAQE